MRCGEIWINEALTCRYLVEIDREQYQHGGKAWVSGRYRTFHPHTPSEKGLWCRTYEEMPHTEVEARAMLDRATMGAFPLKDGKWRSLSGLQCAECARPIGLDYLCQECRQI